MEALHNGTATSIEAAESIEPHLGRLEQMVYDYVHSEGPMGSTSDQCEAYLSLAHQTVSARLNALEKAGLLTRTDDRRPTRSGRNAFVYVAKL